MGLWTHGMRPSAAGNTRSDTALRRAGPGLDRSAKTETTMTPKPVVTLVMVMKACTLGELDDQLVLLDLRPKAMRVSTWRGSLGPGRDVCQQRSLGECRSGRWGYYSLAEGGGLASAPRQHMRGLGRNTLKAVADEAGEGIPVALAEARAGTTLHITERLLSLRRAQPAPPLHTRGVLPAERRETAWVLVAGGQQGRCRGVG